MGRRVQGPKQRVIDGDAINNAAAGITNPAHYGRRGVTDVKGYLTIAWHCAFEGPVHSPAQSHVLGKCVGRL